MKKYLSLVLAMLTVLSGTTFAAPFAVGTVTDVQEKAQEEYTVTQESVFAQVTAETQTSDVLFYEDFEGFDLKRIYSLTPSYRKDGVTATVATTWNGVADANWNIIEENGDKVLHINQANGTSNNVGFDIQNLNIADPGVYTLSYQFKQVLGPNATGVDALWGGSGSSGWFQYALYDRTAGAAVGFSPQIPAIPTKFATDNMGKWYDVEYQYIVKDTGNGTRSFLAKNSLNSWVGTASTIPANHQLSRVRHYHFFQPNNSATIGNLYIDNFKLTYGKYITLKYVDEKGNTIKSSETWQGAKVTLPGKTALGTAYSPAYSVNGVYFAAGDTFTVPADATGEYSVTVTKLPVNAPSNAVLFEDYESKTVGSATASNFTYAADEFKGIELALGDAGYASSRKDLYANAPDNASNKTYVTQDSTAANAPGFQIVGINFSKYGKYRLQYRLYTDASYANHPTTYYFARLDGKELKRWVYPSLSEAQRNTWVDVYYDIEVYEENGVKKLKYDTDKVMDCPEVSTIKFYVQIDGLSTTQTANVWFDDVAVLYDSYKTASFTDEEGYELPFKEELKTANSYTLPTAEKMGFDKNIEFVAPDGKTYYPGMVYTGNDFTFTVKESAVIFFESYDKKSKTNTDVAAEYTAGPMKGDMTNTSFVSEPDATGNRTSVVTSTGKTDNANIYMFTGLNIQTPGLYKFSVEATLNVTGNKSASDNSVNITMYSASSWSPIHDGFTLSDGKTERIEGYIEVFKKDDASIAFRMPTRTNTDASYPISTGIHNVWTRVHFSNIDAASTAVYTVNFDNLKVEYSEKAFHAPVSYNENSIRVNAPAGVRFKSSVSRVTRENKSLTEYGFIVTRKVSLEAKGVALNEFTMNNEKMTGLYVKGVSYGVENGKHVDRIFNMTDTDVFFTAAVYNIPSNMYHDVVVVRPFVKMNDSVLYGEAMSASIYEVAQRLKKSDDYEDYKEIIEKIEKGEEI